MDRVAKVEELQKGSRASLLCHTSHRGVSAPQVRHCSARLCLQPGAEEDAQFSWFLKGQVGKQGMKTCSDHLPHQRRI